MNYESCMAFLYGHLPMYQRTGPAAYKKDLGNTLKLCSFLGNPHMHFPSVHVAGTNGKGSVCHMLAAVLQQNGYRTALYTSPHLLDFRERIRINGKKVSKKFVIAFVEKIRDMIHEIQPSFFEITVAMAFEYFAQEKADIAIIETGLGGRLDSTNVISPLLSLITSVSFDHENMLGNSLAQIAGEKAGIIKNTTPLIVSRNPAECIAVFEAKAAAMNSTIIQAEDEFQVSYEGFRGRHSHHSVIDRQSNHTWDIHLDLHGAFQASNLALLFSALRLLSDKDFNIRPEAVTEALSRIKTLSGLRGRMEYLSENPDILIDIAHNEEALRALFAFVRKHIVPSKLWVIFGCSEDKNLQRIMPHLEAKAKYFLVKPEVPRGMETEKLFGFFERAALDALPCNKIEEAFLRAEREWKQGDLILVCGSAFLVADAIKYWENRAF
jgi:dihydrofolate synthase / folylpolyglutamate synthase